MALGYGIISVNIGLHILDLMCISVTAVGFKLIALIYIASDIQDTLMGVLHVSMQILLFSSLSRNLLKAGVSFSPLYTIYL